MPFHVDHHKPNMPLRTGYPLKVWLQIAGCGLFVLLGGIYRMANGMFSWLNWYGQPVDSGLMIAAGFLAIVFAAIPNSWLERAAKRRSN